MKKVLLLTLVIVFAAVSFIGCAPAAQTPSADASADGTAAASQGAAASDDSLQKIKDKGEFIMGMDISFPPMGFKDESGELTGFDVDMAKAVAEHMGLKVNLQAIDWNSKEMELSTGNIDVIWNGYTITDERKEKVLMSEPYMGNAQVIVVKAGSDIKSLADVAGKRVGVQDGSSAQEAVEANEEFAASIGEMIKFKDNVMALMDLSNGQVDAVAVDSVVADYYSSKQEGAYTILDETLAPEEYGIGFRKGDQSFHDAVMEALKQMKEDGTAAEISNKWFGRDVTTF
ncbi:MAG: amino acid ABC transporter substrate-binding protein [Christensenella sp.]|uniref:amino acid ABC transporter substrate-binding protein n=1 Tax=Christensenella sp. TaxID=1935934 RepID=UPI002B20912A|nr:amino acid ABC transporter substrate-binding protein [Christensenella sp.]MEA5002861.1 amino acid ABC transporter substrate-binding protein [Christensenella sp.]